MTNPNLQPLLPALALVLALTAAAARAGEGEPTHWSFSGFGTLSAVHSTEHEADFVGNHGQPNGAGRRNSTSFSPDSKLGGQVSAEFSSQLSAVLQVVTQQQHDSRWTPQIEWANVQYRFSPALRVRVGRIVLPTFMISEARMVGYANPSVRPPQEVYLLHPLTSNDGIDATHVTKFGDAVNSLSGFYGRSKARLTQGVTARAKPSWGLNNTLESGASTLRVSYVALKADIRVPSLQQLTAGLEGFGAAASAVPVPQIQAAGAQAHALARQLNLHDLSRQTLAIGIAHDPGAWFVSGEYVRFVGSHVFASSHSGYVTAGYRTGPWTPYATLAAAKTPRYSAAPISTAGLPSPLAAAADALNIGVSTFAASIPAPTHKTIGLGLRWDFMKNAAAKLQVDHLNFGADSFGQLANRSASYRPGGQLTLVSLAVDFVF